MGWARISYTSPMTCLVLQIVRFVDEYQPGIVACEFHDALGLVHTLVDKAPYFSEEDFWRDSQYPQPGDVPCEVLKRWQDASGRRLARITSLESTTGQKEFTVFESQLIEAS